MVNVIRADADMQHGAEVDRLSRLFAQGDANAHRFEIHLTDGGRAADLSEATVSGLFLRADGDTILLTGGVSGNAVLLTLTEDCYAVPGRFELMIRVSIGELTMTVYYATGTITRAKTGIEVGS